MFFIGSTDIRTHKIRPHYNVCNATMKSYQKKYKSTINFFMMVNTKDSIEQYVWLSRYRWEHF
jgi:hypothetical protein